MPPTCLCYTAKYKKILGRNYHTMKILFLGNSFTYFHHMPQLFETMASHAGFDVSVKMVTEGGFWLDQFLDGITETARLADKALTEEYWDYVILQGQSAEPALERQRFLRAAEKLCAKIRTAGAIPVFYQTWSYEYGTEKLASTGMAYEEFYTALKEGYRRACTANRAHLVPVGDLFYRMNQPIGSMELMTTDAHHPNLLGSYAAAMCFYKILLETTLSPAWRPEGITQNQQELLWEAIKEL